MAGRSNKEERAQRSYGAPTGPPPVTSRDTERIRMLETQPTAQERRRRIEQQVKEGQEETARSREQEARGTGTRTGAPKPYPTVGTPGRSTEETLRTRGRDIDVAVEEQQ